MKHANRIRTVSAAALLLMLALLIGFFPKEASVVNINKGRKSMQFAHGGEDAIFYNIWCSIEYIKSNTDLVTLHKNASEA